MTTDPTHYAGDTIFAMCRLIERLMNEGYVYTERVVELSERVRNMELGDGFNTTAELRKKGRSTTDEATTATTIDEATTAEDLLL